MEVLKAKMQQSKDELENVREEAVMKEKMFQEEKRKREEIENHISSLSRKITLLEEDLDRSEERYNVANSKLASANQMAEESERLVKSLREKTDQDDGKLSLMEDQAASAKTLAEDSDRQVTEYLYKKKYFYVLGSMRRLRGNLLCLRLILRELRRGRRWESPRLLNLRRRLMMIQNVFSYFHSDISRFVSSATISRLWKHQRFRLPRLRRTTRSR